MARLLPSFAVLLILFLVIKLAIFTVDQRQYAIVFQFSEAKQIIKNPGIRFKIPFLQEVRYFDRRIQTIDESVPARIQTREKMNVKVDSYIKWRIVDVARYYKAVGTDHRKAIDRLRNTVNNMIRNEFGKQMVQDLISGKRNSIMKYVSVEANRDADRIGMEVIDVRVKRIELEDTTLASVYERMRSERKAVANQLRAEGSAKAEEIKAAADKEREIILATSYNQAQQIKGQGDAKATRLYAETYSQYPEFHAFYKSMQAYRESFNKKSDVLILDSSLDFFKFMTTPKPSNP